MSGVASFNFHKTDDVISHLRPYLVKNGIVFTYSVEHHECVGRDYEKKYKGNIETKYERQTVKAVICRLVNADDPSDMIEGVEYGYGIDPQDKGPGKATSYAVKTWLLNQFALKGQPDENTVTTRDGYISEEQQTELHNLRVKADVPLEAFLEYMGASSMETILLSRLAVGMRDLNMKIAKKEAANNQDQESDIIHSLPPNNEGEF